MRMKLSLALVMLAGCLLALLVVLAAAHLPAPAPLALLWSQQAGRSGVLALEAERGMLERVAQPPAALVVDLPRLSPDGRDVAYALMGEGRLQVLAQRSGRMLYRTEGVVQDRLPAWSADGGQLALWSNRRAPSEGGRWQRWDLFVLDTQRGYTRQLTDQGGCIPYNAPAWSPDGRWIAAQYWCAGDQNGLFVIDARTGQPNRLAALGEYGGDLAWSPDGTRLAFRGNRAGDGEIYLLDLHSGVLANLTNSPSAEFQPAWSPDGQRIAFVSNREGRGEIHVLTLATGETVRLTDTGGWGPAWSPDGRLIAYYAGRREPGLYLVPVAGGPAQRVAALGDALQFVGWMPLDDAASPPA